MLLRPFPMVFGLNTVAPTLTITSLGAGSAAFTSSSLQMTTSANIPAGSTTIVAVAGLHATTNILDPTTGNVFDDFNNYTCIGATNHVKVNLQLSLWYCFNCTANPSGGAILAGFPGALATSDYWISAFNISGQSLVTDPLDSNAFASGTSTSPSVTATPVAANTVFCGVSVAAQSSGNTFTQGSGFSSSVWPHNTGSNINFIGGSQTLTAASSTTYAPSIGSSVDWIAQCAAIKY